MGPESSRAWFSWEGGCGGGGGPESTRPTALSGLKTL